MVAPLRLSEVVAVTCVCYTYSFQRLYVPVLWWKSRKRGMPFREDVTSYFHLSPMLQ
jgi:hypothetical protein